MLAERCLVPCDHEGRPHTCLLGPMNRVPTIIFTSLLPDPWAQLWPGKWGGHEGGRPWLSFSPDVLITEVYRRICMGSTQITERLWIWRSVWCLGTNPHGYEGTATCSYLQSSKTQKGKWQKWKEGYIKPEMVGKRRQKNQRWRKLEQYQLSGSIYCLDSAAKAKLHAGYSPRQGTMWGIRQNLHTL